MDLTKTTYSKLSGTMCIHDVTSCDCDVCLLSTDLHSAPILDGAADSGERIHYHYTTACTNFTSTDTALSSPSAQRPVRSTPDQLVETTDNSMNIHQPPDHVIDYWFHRLGLSLDRPSSENSSNLTNFSSQFPLFDGIDGVSSSLINSFHIPPSRLSDLS